MPRGGRFTCWLCRRSSAYLLVLFAKYLVCRVLDTVGTIKNVKCLHHVLIVNR